MSEIPNGFCQCGCGKRTSLITRNSAKLGHVAGTYRQFVLGHCNRRKFPTLTELEQGSIKTDAGCWEWQGGLMSSGYGYVIFERKTLGVHRAAYELTKGKLSAGMQVRHKCDNRRCCNPDHLEQGTIADNMKDRTVRGRSVQGERHHSAKLTTELVQSIRRSTESDSVLGRKYGVDPAAIRRARLGITWKSVPMS